MSSQPHLYPRIGRLAQDTGWLTLGQLGRSAVQAAAFVLVARALGASGYGAFAGIVALVSIVAPFVGWGTENLLVKHGARRPESLYEQWGRTLFWSTVTAAAFGSVVVFLAAVLLPSIGITVAVAVVVADMWLARLVSAATRLYQATDKLIRVPQLLTLLSASRLTAAAILLVFFRNPTLELWALLYLGGAALACAITASIVTLECGAPRWSKLDLSREWLEGLYFATATATNRICVDIDKTMLVRLASLEAVGIYSVAYRIVDVALTPVLALLTSLYARFFAAGLDGVRAPAALAGKTLPFTLAYTGLAGLCLYIVAPAVPKVLGPQFAESVSALRWLALVPVLYGVHRLFAQLLTGADRQGTRTLGEALAAADNIGLNLWWIPEYSWRGAAFATLASESCLVVYMSAAALFLSKLDRLR